MDERLTGLRPSPTRRAVVGLGPRGPGRAGSRPSVRRRGTAAVPAGGGELGVAELLVRRKGVLPIVSVEDLAAVDDTFESEEEYEAFLADLCASRRTGLR
jgi:hypothetical protein